MNAKKLAVLRNLQQAQKQSKKKEEPAKQQQLSFDSIPSANKDDPLRVILEALHVCIEFVESWTKWVPSLS